MIAPDASQLRPPYRQIARRYGVRVAVLLFAVRSPMPRALRARVGLRLGRALRAWGGGAR